ncbi:S8 family serine peptidase [Ignavibacterium album]|uniref:S8 family serine peptidase n=1 Tax=Ignavibacterium album TaxID=591197 RepID=UPI0035B984D6
MKKLALFLFVFIAFIATSLAQVEVSSRLQQAIQEAGPDDYVRALVLLRDQVDLLALDQRLYHEKATLERRAYEVITALQRKAQETQPNLLNYLQTKESAGEVFQYQSFWVSNLVMVEAKPSVLLELTTRLDVAQMDLDAILELDKPEVVSEGDVEGHESVELGLRVIKADQLWAMGITGQGRLLMNIDTGVYPNHPALQHKWRGNHVPSNQAWFDPGGGTTTPNDCDGHGSHTMGTMVGRSLTTPDTVGVAIDAEWIAAKTICSSPHTSNSIAAFQWAMNPDGNPSTIDDMPDAISNSWYDPDVTNECSGIYKTTLDAVEAVGIAVVFSAGNNGPGASTITKPKNINTNEVNIFCVAAIDAALYSGGNNNPIASFSSRGPSTCGGTGSLLIKPEVSAPGVNVRSSGTATGYNLLSGTSMASPHVAGAIALLKQFAPTLTGQQIKFALYNTAIDLGAAGEDNNYGTGLIDLVAAMMSLGTPDSVPPTTITDLSVTNPTSNSLRLTWTAPLDTSMGGVTQYDVRWSLSPITDTTSFYAASPLTYPGVPGAPGTPQELIVSGLNFNTTYYFAIRSRDAWGNWSDVSNSPSGTTLAAPVISVNPTSIQKILERNTTVIDSVIISNVSTSPSTLDFTVTLENNTFPSEAVDIKLVPKNPAIVEGNPDDLKGRDKELKGMSIEGQGGPDIFGYRWIDSDEPNGPQYVWNDISTNPSAVQITSWTGTLDDGYTTVPLGMTFPFYGNNYTQGYLSTNGFLSFNALTSSYFTNGTIPNTSLPNNVIAPFWDDLDGRTQGTVHYLQEPGKFTIQYTNWQKYSGTGSLTFQLVLYSSGKIMYYYNNMNAVLTSATVGIENSTGTDGLQIVYNANYVHNNMAVKIEAAPEWLVNNIFSGTVYNGNSMAVQLTFKTEDYPLGQYSMDMVIQSNDPLTPSVTVPIQMEIVIPVELTSLSAKTDRDNVIIEWQTATETNNQGFEIQRKVKGVESWTSAGYVSGKGTTTERQTYQYIDKQLRAGKYLYRLKQIDLDGTTEYSQEIEVEVAVPEEYVLYQNYPNPFNPSTTIEFSLPEKSEVVLSIYNSLGEKVRELVNGSMEAGYQRVVFDARELPSGTYVYQINAKGSTKSFIQSKKMTLVK